ncbi:MAG TPA: ScpA family protein [Acidimicrobiales bacterium]|nr:ScpA family protein [Acidimicrobiales bacterium]
MNLVLSHAGDSADRYRHDMAYEVHLDVYDGPFNLLLQLISAEEVDVYAISLSEIVEAFIQELRRLEQTNLELATEFLLIAATLVELKCRRLLPENEDVILDEDLSLFEARDYLLARLVECKTFSGAAKELATLESLASRASPRRAGPDERFDAVAPDLLEGILGADVHRAALRAFTNQPARTVSTLHVHEDEFTVTETLDLLVGILPDRPRITLGQLLYGDPSKARLVATFLALLELYKNGLVDLEQAVNFGDLLIIWIAKDNNYEIRDADNYDDSATANT